MAGAFWLLLAILLGPLVVVPATWGVTMFAAKNLGFLVFGLGAAVWTGGPDSPWLKGALLWSLGAFLLAGLTDWALIGFLGVFSWVSVVSLAAHLSDGAWVWIRRGILLAVLGQLGWMGLQAAGLDPIFHAAAYGTQGVEFAVQGGQASCRLGPEHDACVAAYRAQGLQPVPAPVVGWFGTRMDLSLFLGMSLPALATLSAWWLLPLAPILIWLQATVGMVCLGVVLIWVAARRSWSCAALALGTVLAGLVAFVLWRDPQLAGVKPLIWAEAGRRVWDAPLGWGPNALDYLVLIEHPATGQWNFLFNDWLQGALEFGWGAPLAALAYLGSLGRRWRRMEIREWEAACGVGCLALVALFSIPFRIGPVALLGAVYLGRLERGLSP